MMGASRDARGEWREAGEVAPESVLTAGCLAVVIFAAGCTEHAPAPAASHARASATSAEASSFGARQVSLDCSDSLGVPPGQAVGEVPFEGLPVVSASEEPPLARDVGLHLPPETN